jgi:hypothetical protein
MRKWRALAQAGRPLGQARENLLKRGTRPPCRAPGGYHRVAGPLTLTRIEYRRTGRAKDRVGCAVPAGRSPEDAERRPGNRETPRR